MRKIKKYLVYFIANLTIFHLLFVMSCNTSNPCTKDSIKGSWSYCDNEKMYVEIHISDSTVEWCPEVEPLGILYLYELSNDSIYIFKRSEKDILKSGKIFVISNDCISINYLNENKAIESVLLTRIEPDSFIFRRSENKSFDEKEYIRGYECRMKIKDCITIKK